MDHCQFGYNRKLTKKNTDVLIVVAYWGDFLHNEIPTKLAAFLQKSILPENFKILNIYIIEEKKNLIKKIKNRNKNKNKK